MSTTEIISVRGRRVWDSRGRPTVEAEVTLAGGALGRAIAPAGASTGSGEAVAAAFPADAAVAGIEHVEVVGHAVGDGNARTGERSGAVGQQRHVNGVFGKRRGRQRYRRRDRKRRRQE